MADSQNIAPPLPTSTTIKARLEEAYDAIAPTYLAWGAAHSSLRNRYLDKLLQYLLPANPTHASPARTFRVLELGCGAGIPVTERLLNFDFEAAGYPGCRFHITANDISSAQIELGRGKLGGRVSGGAESSGEASDGGDDEKGNVVEWIQGDMMALEFPDENFDAIIGLYSLIHLPREEQEVMIGRIGGWLRRPSNVNSGVESGGMSEGEKGGVMLLTFSEEEIEGVVMEKWLGEEKGWMYWSGWGPDRTVDIVKGAGGSDSGGGLEVLVSEVVSELESIDANFLWLIARRK